ncbi:MAG: GNAT family N-acetyltransferase [Hyphomicrobiales bacterium]
MTPQREHQTELETERLLLTRPDENDAADIAELANNWAVVEHLANLPHPYGPDDARQWIERRSQGQEGEANFAIRLRRLDPKLIGVIGYGALADSTLGHFGYWLGEPYWGQGYATEAALAVLGHAFEHLAVAEIHTGCRPGNTGSRHVLAKCGFDLVGTGMMNSLPLKSEVPTLKYTLTRKAWRHRIPVTIRATTG